MIIADTSALLASVDQDAAEHVACVDVIREQQRPMLVSHMVVAEVDYLLTRRFGIATANRFLSDVAHGAFELASSDAADIGEIVAINTRYADLALGATDCLNVVLAHRNDTLRLFTLDHRHYRAVKPLGGSDAFVLLPADQTGSPQ